MELCGSVAVCVDHPHAVGGAKAKESPGVHRLVHNHSIDRIGGQPERHVCVGRPHIIDEDQHPHAAGPIHHHLSGAKADADGSARKVSNQDPGNVQRSNDVGCVSRALSDLVDRVTGDHDAAFALGHPDGRRARDDGKRGDLDRPIIQKHFYAEVGPVRNEERVHLGAVCQMVGHQHVCAGWHVVEGEVTVGPCERAKVGTSEPGLGTLYGLS